MRKAFAIALLAIATMSLAGNALADGCWVLNGDHYRWYDPCPVNPHVVDGGFKLIDPASYLVVR